MSGSYRSIKPLFLYPIEEIDYVFNLPHARVPHPILIIAAHTEKSPLALMMKLGMDRIGYYGLKTLFGRYNQETVKKQKRSTITHFFILNTTL